MGVTKTESGEDVTTAWFISDTLTGNLLYDEEGRLYCFDTDKQASKKYDELDGGNTGISIVERCIVWYDDRIEFEAIGSHDERFDAWQQEIERYNKAEAARKRWGSING